MRDIEKKKSKLTNKVCPEAFLMSDSTLDIGQYNECVEQVNFLKFDSLEKI